METSRWYWTRPPTSRPRRLNDRHLGTQRKSERKFSWNVREQELLGTMRALRRVSGEVEAALQETVRRARREGLQLEGDRRGSRHDQAVGLGAIRRRGEVVGNRWGYVRKRTAKPTEGRKVK